MGSTLTKAIAPAPAFTSPLVRHILENISARACVCVCVYVYGRYPAAAPRVRRIAGGRGYRSIDTYIPIPITRRQPR